MDYTDCKRHLHKSFNVSFNGESVALTAIINGWFPLGINVIKNKLHHSRGNHMNLPK